MWTQRLYVTERVREKRENDEEEEEEVTQVICVIITHVLFLDDHKMINVD